MVSSLLVLQELPALQVVLTDDSTLPVGVNFDTLEQSSNLSLVSCLRL